VSGRRKDGSDTNARPQLNSTVPSARVRRETGAEAHSVDTLRTMLILGFDPGGVRQFGWCIAETTGDGPLRLRKSGTADHAIEAYERVSEFTDNLATVAAAGIDSPLYWVAKGDRRADQAIRAAMKALGATNVHGTVQQVNSLRGACLVQGVMVGRLVRRQAPEIRLTESHPKALLWLIKVASQQRSVKEVTVGHLSEFIVSDAERLSEHERDAALGAVGASMMMSQAAGWRNLASDDDDAFAPVSPVEYWMPLGGPDQ